MTKIGIKNYFIVVGLGNAAVNFETEPCWYV